MPTTISLSLRGRSHEEIGEPSIIGILIANRGRELLVVHNLAAMVDVERAAFFAARSQGADVSAQRTGA